MRIIKFRAWTKDYDDNWVMDYELPVACTPGYRLNGLLKDSKSQIFMQFTGLLDKNGKEIFEGDIVKWENDYSDGVATVIWANEEDSPYPAFDLEPRVDEELNSFNALHFEGEIWVIGNIYEDKESLK